MSKEEEGSEMEGTGAANAQLNREGDHLEEDSAENSPWKVNIPWNYTAEEEKIVMGVEEKDGEGNGNRRLEGGDGKSPYMVFLLPATSVLGGGEEVGEEREKAWVEVGAHVNRMRLLRDVKFVS